MTLADRIVVINEGKIIQVGTPKELYNCPKNLFVAKFIGTPKMNVLDCTSINGNIYFIDKKNIKTNIKSNKKDIHKNRFLELRKLSFVKLKKLLL